MFRLMIVQFKKDGKKDVMLQWDEAQIEEALAQHTPEHLQHITREAWKQTIKHFKEKSINL